MKILISNDDGIYAKGIETLKRYLEIDGHEVYVVAPAKEESGTGHGVTLHRPLRIKKIEINEKFFGYSVDGKPTDCIKLGYWGIYKDINFDYVISGINRGENLGSDILYSGTVSAAAEATLLGMKSIAVSVKSNGKEYKYETAAKFIIEYLKELELIEFPKETLLNINVPNVNYSDLKGYNYTVQGDRKYIDDFIEREDPQGNKYYWLGGELEEYGDSIDIDFNTVKGNRISITPINLNLTDHKFLKKLKGDRK